MTRRLAWVAVILVGATALVMLLTSLAFVPVSAWEIYVPIATVVGSGTQGFGGDGGPAEGALLNLPTGLALKGDGTLYFYANDAAGAHGHAHGVVQPLRIHWIRAAVHGFFGVLRVEAEIFLVA